MNGENIINIIFELGLVAKIVIFILMFFSVMSWAIIFYKWREIKKAKTHSRDFLESFRKGKKFSDINYASERYKFSPLASVFKAGYNELNFQMKPESGGKNPFNVESLQRVLLKTSNREISKFEKMMGFLATTGSVTPFIGLFGTVWGIMDSFREIGLRGTANLATVAPGIAEALIATAAGLFTAIPAVIAYNHFLSQIKRLVTEIEDFSLEFLNISEKLFL